MKITKLIKKFFLSEIPRVNICNLRFQIIVILIFVKGHTLPHIISIQ